MLQGQDDMLCKPSYTKESNAFSHVTSMLHMKSEKENTPKDNGLHG
jgi:hypothetical protein